jgi:hypothetical protein
MKKAWSRRRFLGVAGASAAAGLSARRAPGAAPPDGSLNAAERATLRAAADVLIPSGEAMASASEAGAHLYLEALAVRREDVRAPLRDGLAALETSAQARRQRAFARLGAEHQVEIVAELERTKPDVFAPLRNLVYEGYYTRPAVQKTLGFVFLPDDGTAPPLEPFDERPLARVRASARLYREVR